MATAERGSTDALFGKFITNVADQLTRDDAVKVATYLDLTPAKRDEIKSAMRAPGLALINNLQKDDIITEDDIDKLCDALTHCHLKRTERIAKKEFEKYKKEREKKERGLIPDDNPDTGTTSYDPGTVKSILQDELTNHDCFQLAIYFSLPNQVVNAVQESRICVKELVEALENRTIISEGNISALLIALKDRGLLRVVNKIKKVLEKQQIVTYEEGPATLRDDGDSGDSVKCRNCGKSSFQEFKYEDKVVALECQNEDCLSKWVVAPTSSSSERATINYNNQTLSYTPPGRLDLSKLEYKAVQDIKELESGDHIVFKRYGMYYHHAILVSIIDSETLDVIHWTSGWPSLKSIFKGKSHSTISRKHEKISFLSGGVQRVFYDRPDQKELVLARAFSLLERSDKDYSFTENNCESLATYCKSGVFYSVQGQLLKKFRPPLQKVMSFFTS